MAQSAGRRRSGAAELELAGAQPSKKLRNDHYTVGLAVEENSHKLKSRMLKAQKANAAMQAKRAPQKAPPVAPLTHAEEPIFGLPIRSAPLEPYMAATRRKALEYIFVHLCGAPEEDVWLRDGTVSAIMHQLQVPSGSSAEVKKVFRDILAARAAKQKYDEHIGPKQRGRKPLIVDCTLQAAVVYRALQSGLSTTQTTVIVNMWRSARALPSLSWSAVNGFVARSHVVYRSRRMSKKSGKEDEGSPWALARVAQCTQFLKQLRLGKLPATSAEVVASKAQGLPPIQVDAIVWWDENHKKQVLGHTSKWENRVARNAFDNEPTPIEFGGVLPAKSMRTAMKFPQEARGCFGCALVKQGDGSWRGVKAPPYCYTGKFVIGIKQWEAKKKAEELRVLPLKGCWTNDPTYGYRQKYGDRWEKEIEAVLGRGKSSKVCITSLIDHVIAESKRIYAGTPHADTFIIFHDGLSQWWEAEAQEYIRVKGFRDRQLRCVGTTNMGNRYMGKVTGDSPEICRGLDAHGFADLKLSMAFHTSLTSTYAFADRRRFGMGTPAEVWRTMCRCWEVEPTSERLVEDILAFERVLQVIVEHNGCVVPDLFFRTGRRARRANDEAQERLGDCLHKPRTSQRKDTLVSRPCHADCEEARRKILGLADEVVEAALDEVDEAAEGLLMLMHLDDVERGDQEETEEDH
jgi:hypothetical protein